VPEPPDPSAATTLMAAVSVRGAPSDPVHRAMIVCAPSEVLAGMVADILATPDESAAAVPRTTWSESSVTVTEESGTHVCAVMSMVWPGVGVVSLTVRLFTAGGYCCAPAGTAKSPRATAAAATIRFTICSVSCVAARRHARPQPFLSLWDPNTRARLHKRSHTVSSRVVIRGSWSAARRRRHLVR
jgi:hypothetical protein